MNAVLLYGLNHRNVYLSKTAKGAGIWPRYAVKEGLESIEYITNTRPVVFRITTSYLDPKKLSKDPITQKDIRYKGVIPPIALKLLK